MTAIDDTHILLDPEELPANALYQRRERAHCKIDRARLKPRLKVFTVELNYTEAHIWCFDHDAIEQRRQQLDHAGVDDAKLERPGGNPRVEHRVFSPERPHLLQYIRNGLG